MDLLTIAHLSVPYDEWKAIFDEDTKQTAQYMGESKVAQADAKTAMILAFDVDMEGLAGYMSAPENAARIGAVTEGHTMYSLTKLPPPG